MKPINHRLLPLKSKPKPSGQYVTSKTSSLAVSKKFDQEQDVIDVEDKTIVDVETFFNSDDEVSLSEENDTSVEHEPEEDNDYVENFDEFEMEQEDIDMIEMNQYRLYSLNKESVNPLEVPSFVLLEELEDEGVVEYELEIPQEPLAVSQLDIPQAVKEIEKESTRKKHRAQVQKH